MAVAFATRNASLRAASAPAQRATSRRSAVVMKATEGKEWTLQQPGITAPTGFFDPVGFTDSPTFTVAEAKRFRESELTHGRVAMLAALGWVVQEEFHPFFGGQVSGPAFDHFQKVESIWPQFWEVITLAIAIAEGYRISIGWSTDKQTPGSVLKPDYQPGDLGFDPLGLYPSDPTAQYDIRTKEINNGRLAMIAWAGFAAQELVSKQTIWKQLVGKNIVPAEEANLFQ